jgi:uncharacterized protein YdhG (YjbR/CyaY superfamily)
MIMMKGDVPRDIDDYLKRYPEDVRTTLGQLRKWIKEAAPKSEEAITYHIPTFKYKGSLVGFGATKKHCAFYVMSNTALKSFKEELKDYDTSTGTIRFPHDAPLPAKLVKRIVKERIMENELALANKPAK